MSDPLTVTCVPTLIGGLPIEPYVVWTDGVAPEDVDPDEPCNDCAVMPGGFHHMMCDRADCPICGAQLLSDFEHGEEWC
jgi:hypothetical protein